MTSFIIRLSCGRLRFLETSACRKCYFGTHFSNADPTILNCGSVKKSSHLIFLRNFDRTHSYPVSRSLSSMTCVDEQKGDLFGCPDDWAIANSIGADVVMEKGVAVVFKKKFEGVDEILAQKKTTGEAAVLKRGSRFIYYLITKPLHSDKPTYETLESSLNAMKQHCIQEGVKNLAMPRIGCGLDGLEWEKVKPLIEKVFSDSGVTVTVFTL